MVALKTEAKVRSSFREFMSVFSFWLEFLLNLSVLRLISRAKNKRITRR
jgi:hypothetical protein